MPLPSRFRLGAYEIVSLLGAGGMGEVYKARDTRLDRTVAIKVLREHWAGEPSRRARLEREARLISKLNHPHICTLYDIGEDKGTSYLVIEYVDGRTLADVLRSGRLPIDRALAIAIQIAEALDVAHRAGIVHRDLKPSNVMLTKSGTKLLDFGIARVLSPRSTTESAITAPVSTLTVEGTLLGTPQYMAPEQLEGREADARSDLFALGAVCYEMVTGRAAFVGESQARVVAAILDDAAPPISAELMVPPALGRIISRCLAKDPEQRWQSASDLIAALELFALPSQDVPLVPASQLGTRRWLLWLGLVTLAAFAAAGWHQLRPSAPPKTFSFSILPPDGTSFANVAQGGPPAISPDGRLIAFVTEMHEKRLLWVRSLDTFDARPLDGTDGAINPFWSPDGRWLGFGVDDGLKKVALSGGPPQMLTRAAFGRAGADWNREDKILFSTGAELYEVGAAGGEPSRVTHRNVVLEDENHLQPFFLPDGRHYLFLVRGGADLQWNISVGELGSNERRVLLKNVSSARYVPPQAGGQGHVLYVRDGQLMAQPFDADRSVLAGNAQTIAEHVGSGAYAVGDFSVSPGGVLAYRTANPGKQELAWYDRAGNQIAMIGDRPGSTRSNVRLSPDGKSVAFTRDAGDSDVWIYDLPRRVTSRFTFSGGHSPMWSPDGTQIAFVRHDTIYRKQVVGEGIETPIWSGEGLLALTDWSADGRYLLIQRWDTRKGIDGRGLWLLPGPLDEHANHEPRQFESPALHGQFAPATGAARWISYDSPEAGLLQTFVRTMPGGPPGKWQVSIDGGLASRWRRDGRELFFLGNLKSLMTVDVGDGPVFHASSPRRLFDAPPAILVSIGQYAPGYDVTADGQQFVTTFPTPETPPSSITIVLNWTAALKK